MNTVPPAAARSIFGNAALYERLCAATEVLARVIARWPHALDRARLVQQTGRAAEEIDAICAALVRLDVLRPFGESAPAWLLAVGPAAVTLEDAFRCALAMHGAESPEPRRPARPEVDMLVMQAAIAVDQRVLLLLRQFPLDRLALAQPGKAAAPRPACVRQAWAVAFG